MSHPDEGGRLTNRIRELRERRGLTLAALAAQLGTTNQQISHLELGKRQLTVQWLVALSRVLGCHPWELIEARLPLELEEDRELIALIEELSPAERQGLLAELRRRRGHKKAS